MSQRPSFQFYHGDWRRNSKLRRCNHAERGIWLEVMCLMADEDEFGILRWPLADIANAVPCRMSELRPLVDRDVMKGADAGEKCKPMIYTPRHGGKDGEPVILIPEQPGPIWYSSRMVRDAYIASTRGKGTRFGLEPKAVPKSSPKVTPTRRIGDGPSSASASAIKTLTPLPPSGAFLRFWSAWPKNQRKQAQGKCWTLWRQKDFDQIAPAILAHVEGLKGSEDWQRGYVPAPMVYLNQRRWEGAETQDAPELKVAMP